MIDQSRFALNRSILPRLGVEEFFEFASRLGLPKIELRNDLDTGIIDKLTPQQVKNSAIKHGIKIITINRLPEFNTVSSVPGVLDELKELLKLAVAIECEAIILVPSRSNSDSRSGERVFKETVEALKTFQPYFEESGVLGFIETLGFADCSVRSPVEAVKAIRESGAKCYKTVYDTFHHFIGPDTAAGIEKDYDVSYTGLVHVSGVTSGAPPDQYTDADRLMVGPDDRMDNLSQIALLEKLGYRGNISFEPFSKEIQGLDIPAVEKAIRQSIKFIQSMAEQTKGASRESARGTS